MFKKIQDEIKSAMRDKDIDKKGVLKMVSSKAQMIAKEKKSDVTDEIVSNAIKKELKQLNQTKDSLKGYEDSDLFKSTMNKIQILSGYLPKEMNKEEVEAKVAEILSKVDYPNFGAKMKAVMAELKGKADKFPADRTDFTICASIYHAVQRCQTFGMVANATLMICDYDDPTTKWEYDLSENPNFENLNAVEMGRLYRYNGGFKFQALGSGYVGGMTELFKNFGLDIDEGRD